MFYRPEMVEVRAVGKDIQTLRCEMPGCDWLHLLDDVSPRLRDINSLVVGHWQDQHSGPQRPAKRKRRH